MQVAQALHEEQRAEAALTMHPVDHRSQQGPVNGLVETLGRLRIIGLLHLGVEDLPHRLPEETPAPVPIVDMERGRRVWIHAGDLGYRHRLKAHFDAAHRQLASFAKRHKMGYLAVNTTEDYLPVLERYFISSD